MKYKGYDLKKFISNKNGLSKKKDLRKFKEETKKKG